MKTILFKDIEKKYPLIYKVCEYLAIEKNLHPKKINLNAKIYENDLQEMESILKQVKISYDALILGDKTTLDVIKFLVAGSFMSDDYDKENKKFFNPILKIKGFKRLNAFVNELFNTMPTWIVKNN